MQNPFDYLFIDPHTHEESLFKVILYINNRLYKIKSQNQIEIYEEFTKLVNEAESRGLKGNHLSMLRGKVFKFLDMYIENEKQLYDRNLLVRELEDSRDAMLRDMISNFPDNEDGYPHIYTLDAYFPHSNSRTRVRVIAKNYSHAALFIRKKCGEFHLEDPPELNLKKLDCFYIKIIDINEPKVLCDLAKDVCPVYYKDDECLLPGYQDFESKFDKAKTLEEKIHVFDV